MYHRIIIVGTLAFSLVFLVGTSAYARVDPFYMNQDQLFPYAISCMTTVNEAQPDPVACCQAVELSNELIRDGFVARDLYPQAQALGELMQPYEGQGAHEVGNVGYYGCLPGGINTP